MTKSSIVFRVGTRQSKLALIQAHATVNRLRDLLPGARFDVVPMESPGDRDLKTDLRESPPDFFTRDLDQAVRAGTIDCAVHSAKDLPSPMPDGIDGCWLPWTEDPRDAIVLPEGRSLAGLPAHPRIGISSARRDAWCRARFPGAELKPIRGTIEQRLALLDRGDYDIVIMAAAALNRLSLGARIQEWIPLDDLQVPDGQGYLALTFRSNDARFLRVRSLFVNAVTFAGAGVGTAESCTLATAAALRRCDVCLYDALMDQNLLDELPKTALRIDVGKRSGKHTLNQAAITELITIQARRGRTVVRLKGGDPGVFGRLAEEVEALDHLHLPYRVIPGISSLTMATTGTGMLLTRRGVSRGFSVMTPRAQDGGIASVKSAERARLPLVFFMATQVAADISRQLMDDGLAGDTPAAVVSGAGAEDESVMRTTLAELPATVARLSATQSDAGVTDRAGLLIVGDVTRYGYSTDWGALRGRRVLITCGDTLQNRAAARVRDLGGIPIQRPLIRLSPCTEALEVIRRIDDYAWIALTSPSAVRCFSDLMHTADIDIRRVPRIISAGPGTTRELHRLRLHADLQPDDQFGTAGILDAARPLITSGVRILRCQSDVTDDALANGLRTLGAVVDRCVVYRNEPVTHTTLPAFDAAFFASSSAVAAFVAQWGVDRLKSTVAVAIGQPTARTLSTHGIKHCLTSSQETVESAIETLAQFYVGNALGEIE